VIGLTDTRRNDMAEREFSDDFDAVGWHLERMSKPDYDPYYDEED
jgi:hypothetical protein